MRTLLLAALLTAHASGKCTYSGWQKKMVCTDGDSATGELPSQVRNHKASSSGGGSGGGGDDGGGSGRDEGSEGAPKVAFKTVVPTKGKKGGSGGGGGGGRVADSGYWPDPLSLSMPGPKETSKVAFLFLTRGPMPLEPLWKKFFRADLKHLFSVHVHPSPAFNCDKAFGRDSPFSGRCVPRPLTVRTAWGSPGLVAAARNMVSFALLDDPANAYFALLGDRCVPLWPLPVVHAFLHDTKVRG